MMTITLRLYSDQDFEAVHSIKRQSCERNKVDPLSTLESIPTPEELRKSLDVKENSSLVVYVAEIGNEIVGYGRVSWWSEADGTLVYIMDVQMASAYAENEREGQLLHLLEEKVVGLAKSHNDAQKIVIGTNESSANEPRLQLLQKEGFAVVWKLVEMEFTSFQSLQKPQIADSFTIRGAKPEDFRAIYEANSKVYAGVFGSVPMSDEDYADFLEDSSEYKFWLTAWHGDELVGFVLSHIEKGRGVMKEVTVLPEFRRKGLAKALLITNLQLLQKSGVTMARLHTDAEGKAGGRQLYENVGFKPLKVHYRLRKTLK
jgi:mycothiol synthase